jgi:hypothetical protein
LGSVLVSTGRFTVETDPTASRAHECSHGASSRKLAGPKAQAIVWQPVFERSDMPMFGRPGMKFVHDDNGRHGALTLDTYAGFAIVHFQSLY